MARAWTLELLSARLKIAGWNASRSSLAKLEAKMLPVADHHLFFLAKIFDVPLRELFPKIDPQDLNLHETLNRFMRDSSRQDEG